MSKDLDTKAKNTWCPGCFNCGIETAFKRAVSELVEEGRDFNKFVILSGIGCHAKIVDYVNLNSFYSIHGRVIPPATGIKVANPDLKVIGFQGDGDGYNEGMEHLIWAAKKNTDITVVIHNNRVFALTTGQYTGTSPKGFPGRSTPKGSIEEPFNPLELMLASKASFVARGYAGKVDHLKDLMKEAIKHKGFSFIDILQPCVTYFNTNELYNKNIYELAKRYNCGDYSSALKKAGEWNYSSEDKKIPIGLFYLQERETYEELILRDINLLKSKKVDSFDRILSEKL